MKFAVVLHSLQAKPVSGLARQANKLRWTRAAHRLQGSQVLFYECQQSYPFTIISSMKQVLLPKASPYKKS